LAPPTGHVQNLRLEEDKGRIKLIATKPCLILRNEQQLKKIVISLNLTAIPQYTTFNVCFFA